jgi:triosephosphate isomerase
VLTNRRVAVTIGVSLKMYFGYEQTVRWCEVVRDISLAHPAVTSGAVELFVIPSYPVLSRAKELFEGTKVGLGAQNLHCDDFGPVTGEVSGTMLAEMGCRYVEVGHAERRRMFGETDDIVAAKTAAALRNGLVPVICIGESEHRSSAESLQMCVGQIESALSHTGRTNRVIVAYEPLWAIGAPHPASADHIRTVCAGLAEALDDGPEFMATVIYGGAAGCGLLSVTRGCVGGLFLGRSAHDPSGLTAVLDEAVALRQ